MGGNFSCFTDDEDECRKFNTRLRKGLVKLFQQVEPVFEDADLQLFFAETEIACRQLFTSYAATLKAFNEPSASLSSSSSRKKKSRGESKGRNNNNNKSSNNEPTSQQNYNADNSAPATATTATQLLLASQQQQQQFQQNTNNTTGKTNNQSSNNNPTNSSSNNNLSGINSLSALIPLSKTEGREFVALAIPQCDVLRLTRLFASYVSVADRLNPDRNRVAVIEAWLKFDLDASGDLDRDELEQMVVTLNFDDGMKKRLLRKVKSQVGAEGSLSFVQFDVLYSGLVSWLELEHVWRSVTEGVGQNNSSTSGNNNNNNSSLNAARNRRLTTNPSLANNTNGGINGKNDSMQKTNKIGQDNDDDDTNNGGESSASLNGSGNYNNNNNSNNAETNKENATISNDPNLNSSVNNENDDQINKTQNNNNNKNNNSLKKSVSMKIEGTNQVSSKNNNNNNNNNSLVATKRTNSSSTSSSSSGAAAYVSSGGVRLSTAGLQMFLQVVQKDSDPRATANYLATALGGSVDRKSFMRYLTDRELNCVLDLKRCAAVYQDMTQPICHYFISSSHNTYLTGDQLASRSDPDMFRKCLLEGCRCVEIDCWTGPDGKTPIVYHGYTPTSKITFESCIEAISEAAFVTSDFPVILSLELHVNSSAQLAMVEIMTRIFGDSLFRPTYPGGSRTEYVITPAQHRRKFFLKAKRIRGSKFFQKNVQASHAEMMNALSEKEEQRKAKRSGEPIPHEGPVNNMDDDYYHDEDSDDDEENDGNKYDQSDDDDDDNDNGGGKKKSKKAGQDAFTATNKPGKGGAAPSNSHSLIAKLSDLIAIESWRFKSLDLQEQREPQPHEVCSLTENTSLKFSDNQGPDYAEYNKYRLTRIYPSGSRVTSSNYNAQKHWNCGAQLVAINWQSHDYESRFYKGRFVDNGGSGYLLKPAYLRAPMRPIPSQMLHLQAEYLQQQQLQQRFLKSTSSSSNGAKNYNGNYTNNNNSNNNFSQSGVAGGASGSGIGDLRQNSSSAGLGVTMTMSVISALCLPKPQGALDGEIVDPYVKIWLEGPDMHDEQYSSHSRAHCTTVIDNNGFHPIWRGLGDDVLSVRVPVPEMTTLCIQVLDSDIDADEELAEAFLPVHLIRSGVRCVPLWSPYNGEALQGSLLMVSIIFDHDVHLDDPVKNPHDYLVGTQQQQHRTVGERLTGSNHNNVLVTKKKLLNEVSKVKQGSVNNKKKNF